MKILKLVSMALLVMSSSIISAQEKVIHLDEVIVSSQEESEKAFGQLSNYIAFDDDFKYRYELRKSKLNWQLCQDEKNKILEDWLKKSIKSSEMLEKKFDSNNNLSR